MNTIERLEKLQEELKIAKEIDHRHSNDYTREQLQVAAWQLEHEAVTSLPALIAVAKAAEAVKHDWESSKIGQVSGTPMNELRDALAEIELEQEDDK